MFVLELTYTAPLDRVDALAAEHHAWVDDHFAAGTFIASGRKKPRDGGVILAVGDDRAAVEALVAADPFVVAGVCAYRITEFAVARTAPGLAKYREQRPPRWPPTGE
ncbi:YciI family protein [Streptomyces niveus]|uniref:YciI family protein n=1 Tax=Streptomyces niveus TaxID=193462 RepID=UPI003638C22F